MTKQKSMILETIRKTDRHMTSEEIFIETRKKLPNVAMATVYNNLKALAKEGLIVKLNVPGRPDHYDRNVERHEHIVCERCGRIMDVHPDDFIGIMEKKLGIHITGYDLMLYYVCEDCRGLDTGSSME